MAPIKDTSWNIRAPLLAIFIIVGVLVAFMLTIAISPSILISPVGVELRHLSPIHVINDNAVDAPPLQVELIGQIAGDTRRSTEKIPFKLTSDGFLATHDSLSHSKTDDLIAAVNSNYNPYAAGTNATLDIMRVSLEHLQNNISQLSFAEDGLKVHLQDQQVVINVSGINGSQLATDLTLFSLIDGVSAVDTSLGVAITEANDTNIRLGVLQTSAAATNTALSSIEARVNATTAALETTVTGVLNTISATANVTHAVIETLKTDTGLTVAGLASVETAINSSNAVLASLDVDTTALVASMATLETLVGTDTNATVDVLTTIKSDTSSVIAAMVTLESAVDGAKNATVAVGGDTALIVNTLGAIKEDTSATNVTLLSIAQDVTTTNTVLSTIKNDTRDLIAAMGTVDVEATNGVLAAIKNDTRDTIVALGAIESTNTKLDSLSSTESASSDGKTIILAGGRYDAGGRTLDDGDAGTIALSAAGHVLTQQAQTQTYSATYLDQAISANAYILLVDVSDTVNYPHTATTNMHLVSYRYSTNFVSVGGNVRIQIGVITAIDGTDATIKYQVFEHPGVGTVTSGHSYAPGNIQLNAHSVSNMDTVDTTDVHTGLVTMKGSFSNAMTPGIGDMVAYLTVDGTCSISLHVQYFTS